MTDMLALAGQVAAALGDGWAATKGAWEDGTDAYVFGPDHAQLHLRTGTYQVEAGKMEIGGNLPRGWSDHTPYTVKSAKAITVSLNKSPERIAGDITRRLLPQYTVYLAATRERKEASDAYDGRVQAFGDKFIGTLPGAQWSGSRRSHRDDQPTEVSFGRNSEGVSGTVHIMDDQVRISDLRMSHADALRFAAWLSKR